MYCDRRIEEWIKTPTDKIFQTKDPPDKSSRTKTPRTIEREFVQGDFVRIFCTRPTKKWGFQPRQQKFRAMNGAHLASPIRGELGYAHWPQLGTQFIALLDTKFGAH